MQITIEQLYSLLQCGPDAGDTKKEYELSVSQTLTTQAISSAHQLWFITELAGWSDDNALVIDRASQLLQALMANGGEYEDSMALSGNSRLLMQRSIKLYALDEEQLLSGFADDSTFAEYLYPLLQNEERAYWQPGYIIHP